MLRRTLLQSAKKALEFASLKHSTQHQAYALTAQEPISADLQQQTCRQVQRLIKAADADLPAALFLLP